jgi:hypothetical protein
MRVYVGFTDYGETVIGVYSQRNIAEKEVTRVCPYKNENHKHNDQNICGVTSYPLNETVEYR